MNYIIELKITCDNYKFKTFVYTENLYQMLRFLEKYNEFKTPNTLMEFLKNCLIFSYEYIHTFHGKKRIATKKQVKLFKDLEYVLNRLNGIPTIRKRKLSAPILRTILTMGDKKSEIIKIRKTI